MTRHGTTVRRPHPRLPAPPGVEFRRRLRAIASGACCFHANACRQRSSLTGRILHVAHEFEAKAKKQSRTGFGGCRVVIDDCERRIPSNHRAGAGYFACVWPGKPHPKTMPIRPRHRVRLGKTARAGRVTGCPRTLTRRRGLQSSSRPIGLRDPSKTRSPYHKGGDTNGCSRSVQRYPS